MKFTRESLELLDSVLTSAQDSTSIDETFLKIQEELGEAAAEYLSWKGSVNASKSVSGTSDDLMEESIDALITALDLVHKVQHQTGTEDAKAREIFRRKLLKWSAKL